MEVSSSVSLSRPAPGSPPLPRLPPPVRLNHFLENGQEMPITMSFGGLRIGGLGHKFQLPIRSPPPRPSPQTVMSLLYLLTPQSDAIRHSSSKVPATEPPSHVNADDDSTAHPASISMLSPPPQPPTTPPPANTPVDLLSSESQRQLKVQDILDIPSVPVPDLPLDDVNSSVCELQQLESDLDSEVDLDHNNQNTGTEQASTHAHSSSSSPSSPSSSGPSSPIKLPSPAPTRRARKPVTVAPPKKLKPRKENPKVIPQKETMTATRHFNSSSTTRTKRLSLRHCYFCNKECSRLERHLATHTKERAFLCHHNEEESASPCQKRFTHQSSLNEHVKLHSAEGRLSLTCTTCHKIFTQKISLDRHVKTIHEKSVRFPCTHPNCHDVFTTKPNLERHMRTVHDGRKDFKCQEPNCGKAFGHKWVLSRHRNTVHLKLKLHSCPKCAKCFGQSSDRNQHLKICKK